MQALHVYWLVIGGLGSTRSNPLPLASELRAADSIGTRLWKLYFVAMGLLGIEGGINGQNHPSDLTHHVFDWLVRIVVWLEQLTEPVDFNRRDLMDVYKVFKVARSLVTPVDGVLDTLEWDLELMNNWNPLVISMRDFRPNWFCSISCLRHWASKFRASCLSGVLDDLM